MRVDHRGLHIFMAEQFLHFPDIDPGHQQVRRETVTQSVHAGVFVDICFF